MGLLDLIPSIIDLFRQVAPNTAQSNSEAFQLAEDKLKAGLQTILTQAQAAQAQVEVNKVEAQSTNWFIAGARPYVMWICGLGLTIQYLLVPLSTWIAVLVHSPDAVAQLQALHLPPDLIYTLNGLLGLGQITRTYEKSVGIHNRH